MKLFLSKGYYNYFEALYLASYVTRKNYVKIHLQYLVMLCFNTPYGLGMPYLIGYSHMSSFINSC